MNVYLRTKDIDQRLKVKVVKYMQFKLKRRSSFAADAEERILSELSEDLRSEVLIESNIKFVKRSKVLSRFSKATQQAVSMQLERVNLMKDERIFEEGDYEENPYYYFLKQGSLDFFVESYKGQ